MQRIFTASETVPPSPAIARHAECRGTADDRAAPAAQRAAQRLTVPEFNVGGSVNGMICERTNG